MKFSHKIRISVLGAACLMLAGLTQAQNLTDSFTHGNACTGSGIKTSIWGVYNPSTSAAITVNCPTTNTWTSFSTTQERWIQLSAYNRSAAAGTFTCTMSGINNAGQTIWNPPTFLLPKGAASSNVTQINIGQPPVSVVFISVSCQIPKATSTAITSASFVTGISIKAGS